MRIVADVVFGFQQVDWSPETGIKPKGPMRFKTSFEHKIFVGDDEAKLIEDAMSWFKERYWCNGCTVTAEKYAINVEWPLQITDSEVKTLDNYQAASADPPTEAALLDVFYFNKNLWKVQYKLTLDLEKMIAPIDMVNYIVPEA